MTQNAAPPYKQLRRPVTDRIVAGVCSGLGRYLGVDPVLVRVIFAVAVILTGGLALIAYPVMWFLMPEEPSNAPAWPTPAGTYVPPATHTPPSTHTPPAAHTPPAPPAAPPAA
jgi:phage shock protein C